MIAQSPPPNSEWLQTIRRMHRRKRLAGIWGCLIGAVLMLFGRFRPDIAPAWTLEAGLIIVGLAWALFAWVIYDRWRWAKANPHQSNR